MIGHCAVPGCTGHLGRHANCLSEALWDLGQDYADEYGGDTASPAGFSMLFLFDESVWLSILAGSFFGDLGVPDFIIAEGTYVLLTQYDSGQVFMEGFASEAEARQAFDDRDIAYGRWAEINVW